MRIYAELGAGSIASDGYIFLSPTSLLDWELSRIADPGGFVSVAPEVRSTGRDRVRFADD